MPCWGVQKGYGSNVTIEFGEPSLRIDKPWTSSWYLGRKKTKKELTTRHVTVRGQWHLWIHCCYWNLNLKDAPLTHNESSDSKIEEALRILNGQQLISVNIDRSSRHTKFEFDLGAVFETAPYEDLDDDGDPYESWLLFFPDGNVLTYRADGKFSNHLAIEPCNEKEWKDF
jgi:hypothetical protein